MTTTTAASTSPSATHPTRPAAPPWDFKVFVDDDCPLCAREAALWRRLDRGRQRLILEDISGADFDAHAYGKTREDFMREIHGQRPDGALVTGMEVFRRAYAAVGWGWLLAPTSWPILRPIFDAGYRFFAKHRLRLTGRSTRSCAPDEACATPSAADAKPR
jgi:predicted DCC family thiol-disulfide oxidoreductase YuxK